MLPSLQKLLAFLKGFESLHPNPVYAINFLYHTLHSLLKKINLRQYISLHLRYLKEILREYSELSDLLSFGKLNITTINSSGICATMFEFRFLEQSAMERDSLGCSFTNEEGNLLNIKLNIQRVMS